LGKYFDAVFETSNCDTRQSREAARENELIDYTWLHTVITLTGDNNDWNDAWWKHTVLDKVLHINSEKEKMTSWLSFQVKLTNKQQQFTNFCKRYLHLERVDHEW